MTVFQFLTPDGRPLVLSHLYIAPDAGQLGSPTSLPSSSLLAKPTALHKQTSLTIPAYSSLLSRISNCKTATKKFWLCPFFFLPSAHFAPDFLWCSHPSITATTFYKPLTHPAGERSSTATMPATPPRAYFMGNITGYPNITDIHPNVTTDNLVPIMVHHHRRRGDTPSSPAADPAKVPDRMHPSLIIIIVVLSFVFFLAVCMLSWMVVSRRRKHALQMRQDRLELQQRRAQFVTSTSGFPRRTDSS